MRQYLIALGGAIQLASVSAAFVQSQQGGYLGDVTASRFVAPTDPGYSKNGAPRAGAPTGSDAYTPIAHQHSR